MASSLPSKVSGMAALIDARAFRRAGARLTCVNNAPAIDVNVKQ